MRREGLFIITTPNRKFRLLPFQPPFNRDHYQEFTAKRLLATLVTVFRDVQIKGIRARDWIEAMERKRVRKSPYQVYIRDPLNTLLSRSLPAGIKRLFKKSMSRMRKIPQSERESGDNNQVSILYEKFSMDDFYLETRMIDKSMDLQAICKKI